jgi:hypothetical protein
MSIGCCHGSHPPAAAFVKEPVSLNPAEWCVSAPEVLFSTYYHAEYGRVSSLNEDFTPSVSILAAGELEASLAGC